MQLWIIFSFLSLFLLSFCYFFLSIAQSGGTGAAPYTIIMYASLGWAFTASMIVAYRHNKDSQHLKSDIRKLKTHKKMLLFSVLAGLLNLCGLICLSASFYSDPASAGIAASITSGTVILVAVSCLLIWKEKMTIMAWIGVVIAVAGIIICGATPSKSIGVVIFAIAATILFSLSNLSMKYAKILGLPSSISNVVLGYSHGIPCSLVILINCMRGVPIDGLRSGNEVGISILAGILGSCGIFSMNYAIGHGIAGITVAIARSNGVVLLILNWLIMDRVPSTVKMIGALIIVVGVIILSCENQWRQLFEYLKRKSVEVNLVDPAMFPVVTNSNQVVEEAICHMAEAMPDVELDDDEVDVEMAKKKEEKGKTGSDVKELESSGKSIVLSPRAHVSSPPAHTKFGTELDHEHAHIDITKALSKSQGTMRSPQTTPPNQTKLTTTEAASSSVGNPTSPLPGTAKDMERMSALESDLEITARLKIEMYHQQQDHELSIIHSQ